MTSPLWENARWQVVLPTCPITRSHLALVDRQPDMVLDVDTASALLDAYRRSRAALWAIAGARGFRISFAVNWQPDPKGIGEPEPVLGARRALHVFGRGPDDAISPSLAMAVPRPQREPAAVDEERSEALAAALDHPTKITIAAPTDQDCDGCSPEVLTTQERWRADDIRVIRPRSVMIDPQVIVLPLRHVSSLGDLTAQEVVSINHRLTEVRDQFHRASGVTGLSCFANDGAAARQETPHVHLHVFGRSSQESANPFELLAGRLPNPPTQRGR